MPHSSQHAYYYNYTYLLFIPVTILQRAIIILLLMNGHYYNFWYESSYPISVFPATVLVLPVQSVPTSAPVTPISVTIAIPARGDYHHYRVYVNKALDLISARKSVF